MPGLPLDLRMKNDLHQHVPQLLTQEFRVVEVNGIHSLVGFLQKIHPDGPMRLHLVPRAAVVRVTQDRNDRDQIVRRVVLFFRVCVHRPLRLGRNAIRFILHISQDLSSVGVFYS